MVFPLSCAFEHVGIVPGVIEKSLSNSSVTVLVNPPEALLPGWAKFVCVCRNRLALVSVVCGLLGRTWKLTQDLLSVVEVPGLQAGGSAAAVAAYAIMPTATAATDASTNAARLLVRMYGSPPCRARESAQMTRLSPSAPPIDVPRYP